MTAWIILGALIIIGIVFVLVFSKKKYLKSFKFSGGLKGFDIDTQFYKEKEKKDTLRVAEMDKYVVNTNSIEVFKKYLEKKEEFIKSIDIKTLTPYATSTSSIVVDNAPELLNDIDIDYKDKTLRDILPEDVYKKVMEARNKAVHEAMDNEEHDKPKSQ
ncbi:MAG: hypothetical protein ABH873_04530 [Candidatus Firestonebacteria bacterium]